MKKKHKIRGFRVFLVVYTLILIIGSALFLSYTDDCLKEYESAQSENAMPNIIYDFKKMIKDGSLVNYIIIPESMNNVDESAYKEAYLDMLKSFSSFSYEKDSASYLTEEPIYDVLADGEIVGRIRLKGCNERTIFGILTIMDWKAQSIEPVFEANIKDAKTIKITVPVNYTVSLNGNELTEKDTTGERIAMEGMDNLAEYVKLPESVVYEVSSAEDDVIIVCNEKGEEVETKPDNEGNIVIPITFEEKEISEERKEIAYEIAKMWEDFVTNDLSGSYHGLNTIQQYLVKDSYYYNLAEEYAKGPDIGLVSDHTIADPGYTDLKVDQYVEYSDISFSCHVYFKKNMKLTRAHNKLRTEIVDSTFYFVYYDDTTQATGNEDNEDNPHWCMVDMVATTQ